MKEDAFVEALRTLLQEGGFVVYRAFTPNEDDPDAQIEALVLARSPEMMEAVAINILSLKAPSIH
jgi:hypothetical protein